MTLGVELASVAGGVGGYILQQTLVDFRKDDDISLVAKMEPIDLLDYQGETYATTGMVANCREYATEPRGDRIVRELPRVRVLLTEFPEVRQQLPVNEFQHLVGSIGHRCPTRPSILAVESAAIGKTVEGGLFFPPALHLVKCLEEKQPRELLHVVPRLHAIVSELIAGAADGFFHFAATMFNFTIGSVLDFAPRVRQQHRQPSMPSSECKDGV